jgi:transcriptional regulator with PAS, ATPase and Fis domain
MDLGLHSVLCVPVSHRDKILGVVYLDTTSPLQAFGEADLLLVEEFAKRIAPVIAHAVEQAQLQSRLHSLEEEVRTRYSYASIVGRSKPMRELFGVLDSVTDTDVTVYIYGETGTGKDLVARALHYNSRRGEASFVSVNCAALPESLLESELFGHVKGAFTGAESDRAGLIETASGGTLFLDEIGIMPLDMQAKLLRVIEEQKVRRVGSTDARDVDVRIVCASNTRLENLVEEGAFRQDLFYRLNVVRIELPPLRDRREDIPFLTEHFLKEFAEEAEENLKRIDSEALAKLYAYTYPGNVRQLRNILQQAFLTSRERITVKHVDAALRAQKHEAEPESAIARKLSIEEYIKEFVVAHQHDHTETELARLLGITRQHLYKKRKDWGIPRPK